jgi:hypothetical protein
MLGVRGFYAELFPCFTIGMGDSIDGCGYTKDDSNLINMYWVLLFMLVPQFITFCVLLYDTILMIKNKSEDEL